MSNLLERDDEFRAALPDKAGLNLDRWRITWGFTLALFAIQTGWGLIRFAYLSVMAAGFIPSTIFVTAGFDLIRSATMSLLTAWILQAFWKRLFPSLVRIRALLYREALAMVLMIGILLH